MVTQAERAALMKFARPLKPQGPDLIVTIRTDLFEERMLKQYDKGKLRPLWWQKEDKANNRIQLAFGPGR